jgi:hypothetical protein
VNTGVHPSGLEERLQRRLARCVKHCLTPSSSALIYPPVGYHTFIRVGDEHDTIEPRQRLVRKHTRISASISSTLVLKRFGTVIAKVIWRG